MPVDRPDITQVEYIHPARCAAAVSPLSVQACVLECAHAIDFSTLCFLDENPRTTFQPMTPHVTRICCIGVYLESRNEIWLFDRECGKQVTQNLSPWAFISSSSDPRRFPLRFCRQLCIPSSDALSSVIYAEISDWSLFHQSQRPYLKGDCVGIHRLSYRSRL